MLFNPLNLLSKATNVVRTNLEQVRTRITCSRSLGKPKSVRTAMDRFFRLDKNLWIRAAPGYHHHLWRKTNERRYLLQQSYLLHRHQGKVIERMAGPYFKKIKLNYFVDKPFTLYQSYLNRNYGSIHIQESKFFP